MAKFGMSVDVIHIDGWLDTMQPDGGKELLCFDEKRFPGLVHTARHTMGVGNARSR